MTHFEMKSILKSKTTKLTSRLRLEESTQSHSIGAVRWNLPEENLQAHSSAPSSHFKSSAPSTRSQQHPRQNGLKDLKTLQECVNFINHWKEQVAQVCKGKSDPEEGSSQGVPPADHRTERSLEESRKLILLWASELNNVDKLSKECREEDKETGRVKGEQDLNEELQRIMEWAKELQSASESCGVQSEELGQVLRLLGLRKKRLVNLLPLLEFITWSLLKEDSKDMIPQLWLSAKQHTWKAGAPRYIPKSVWSWISSASADVTLDPLTNHPWLQLSDDYLKVQEGRTESALPYSPQRFDSWPGVLGWEGYSSGRHYWEVDIANNGYWRIGLTTGDSKRLGRFPMNPRSGYWSLWRSTRQFYACTNPETLLPISLVPRRMGIYLDYGEGQISFFNAENKSHIYTFTGTFREKLYPLFAPLDGRTLITIVSPHEISAF
ncbi:zinc-binding protein A33 [Hypomesus transpacificus]|uniref:zinc-binding protein A33 n=1 Tax=Hypomesus transpacificus TaxID=137520 RepID=UPI001F08779B|nr:zinc-binding protein A33 [Hypomesus transpacificus]